jgi:hypothetical protein
VEDDTEDDLVIVNVDQQIWHLRMAGITFEEIEHKLQIPRAEAIRRYRTFMVDLAKEWGVDDREHMKALNMMRLEMVMRGHLARAMGGDPISTDRVIKIVDTQNKMGQLYSVDPSTEKGQTQIFVVQGDKESYVEALRRGREIAPSGPDPDDGEDEEGE